MTDVFLVPIRLIFGRFSLFNLCTSIVKLSYSVSPRREKWQRVYRRAVDPNFKVDMWPCAVARTPNIRYVLALHHTISIPHMVSAVMGIHRVMPIAMVDADVVAKPAIPAREFHNTTSRCQDRRAEWSPNIYPLMVG